MSESKLLEVLKLKQQLTSLKQKQSYREMLIHEIIQLEKKKSNNRKIIKDLSIKVNNENDRIGNIFIWLFNLLK